MTNPNKTGGRWMAEIVFKDESYQVMGACFEVYNE